MVQRLDAIACVKVLHQAISDCKPISLIRLNDGEGALLGYPDATELDDLSYFLRIWLPGRQFTDELTLKLRKELLVAIDAADIVGLPSHARALADPRCAHAIDFAVRADAGRATQYCDSVVHHHLQFGLLLELLLLEVPYCGLIGSHDLRSAMRDTFEIDSVDQWFVPSDSFGAPGGTPIPHFPDAFEQLRENIRVPFKGATFLVGAGVYGKVYCRWIREQGGVAIDVGSLFDGWSGMRSRDKIERFPSVYELDLYRRHRPLSLQQRISRLNRLMGEVGSSSAPVNWSSPTL